MAKEIGKKRRRDSGRFNDELMELQQYEQKKQKEQSENTVRNIVIDKEIKYKNQKQKELVKTIHENEITIVHGSAGTGKTFLALKAAIEILKMDGNNINQILLTKPIVEAGESIGFLPGDIKEKTDPYMGSFISNLEILVGKQTTKNLIEQKVIKWNPLPYLRGDTFRNSVAILDEAQNTTVTAIKLFLSRKSEESKLIVMGDVDQSDLKLKGKEKNGLMDAYERLQGVKGIGFIEFTEDEIVRSGILREIMKKYKS